MLISLLFEKYVPSSHQVEDWFTFSGCLRKDGSVPFHWSETQLSLFVLAIAWIEWVGRTPPSPNLMHWLNIGKTTVRWLKKSKRFRHLKVEKILKGSLDSISSPSPSVKIQIMGGKVCLRRKGKTFFVFKSLLTTSSNVLPLHLSRP